MSTTAEVTIAEPVTNTALAAAANPPISLVERAVMQGASLEMIERLITMQERVEANNARKAFDAAIAAAKAEMPVINKNRVVDFTTAKGNTTYRHEDLAEISRTAGPILAKYGLSYRFRTSVENRIVTVTCLVSHRDGHSEENSLAAAVDESGNKNHLQAISSASTYLQRMTLKASLGLAAGEDDDGRAAGSSNSQPAERITEEQAETLRKAVEFKGRTVEALCARLKIATLLDLKLSRFESTLAWVQKLEDATNA